MIQLQVKVLLITAGISMAAAIRCYDCNSSNNTMCLDPSSYDQETLRLFMVFAECGQGVIPQQNYFCRKIVQEVFHRNRESDIRVARGCGWVRAPIDCYKADNEDHMETVCQCFEDGCNAATTIVAKWSLLAATAATVLNKWR